MQFKKNSYLQLVLAIVFLATIASCNVSRKAAYYEAKPMSTGRIVRKVVKQAPEYKSYESKRMAISYYDGNKKGSLTGQLKIDYDKTLIVTLRKMNLPVARAHITTDSITVVNFIEKNYVQDQLSIINELFGVDIGYEMLQALLTADVSKLVDSNLFEKDIVSDIDSNQYRIDSQFNRKIDRALQQSNQQKLKRYMQSMDDSEFTSYSAWIDPRDFVLRRIEFNDIKNNEKITVEYDEYKPVGRSLYPQIINLSFSSALNNLQLEIKVSRPSVNETKDFNFSIPDTYERFNF
ncbi:MAG: DUF4292 domain-containing protein [Prolixibacteraceae bacterium]|jgi:hypothetical protein|nr:DUF4292 domain-containing protein [Prolixibacteraceae bacterium]